ncbi:MAG: chemotaxis protein CheW [Candidatus Sericytochromatia bacterium]
MNKNFEEIDYKNIVQFVTFNIDNEIYAIDIFYVQEILKKTSIISVPLTKDYIEGLMNIRGNIIPIVNMRKKMCKNYVEDTEDTRIIIISYNNRKVGFVVDSMNQVISIFKDKIQSKTSYDDKTFMSGIYVTKEKFTEDENDIDDLEKFITIVDINKLMEVDE